MRRFTRPVVTRPNRAPRWDALSLQYATNGVTTAIPLYNKSSDPDGDKLSWARTGSAFDTAPVGFTVDSAAGILYVDGSVPLGSYVVELKVTDPKGGQAVTQMSVDVVGNWLPTWTDGYVGSGDTFTLIKGQAFSYTFQATDLDADAINFIYSNLTVPAWMNINPQVQVGTTKEIIISGTVSALAPLENYPIVISLGGIVSRTFGFAVAAAGVFDYYISPTGSDSNPGTLASPWAITALWTKGATYKTKRLGLLDGAYTPNSGFLFGATQSVAAYIPPAAVGTAGAKTVIQAVNARGAVIDGTGLDICLYIGAAYVTVDGLTVRSSLKKGIYTNNDNSLIQNCHVYDIRQLINDNINGIRTDSGATNCVIRNNKIHYIRNLGSTQNENCIEIYYAPGVVIENNTCYDAFLAIHIKDTAPGAIVRYNYVYSAGEGMRAQDNGHAFAFTAYGNVFEGVSTTLFNSINMPEVAGTAIYNNTVVLTVAAYSGWVFRGSGNTLDFYNNLLVRDGGGTSGEFRDITATYPATFNVCDYNLYGTTATFSVPRGTGVTFAQWKSATGKDANAQQADPAFVGGTGPSKYKLSVGSAGYLDGHVGGVIGGAAVNVGAYALGTEQIGVDW